MIPDQDASKADEHDLPLGQISTIWTMIARAHGGPRLAEAEAQQRFMDRYHGAVYRYFLAVLRDPDTAHELFQTFAYRFLRGDFKKFDPGKGRFRDYLKAALLNMVRDHWRRQPSLRHLPLEEIPEPAASAKDDQDALDREFLLSWRDELLARTWQALRKEERRRGVPFHIVLQKSMQNPELTSADIASQLNRETNPSPPLSPALVRKSLQLARDKFADLLVAEVASSLGHPSAERVEQELIDLGLIDYCREAMNQHWIIS